jgi:hypothetical protein
LTANGGPSAVGTLGGGAGIGGSENSRDGGTVIINGGIVTAIGATNGAGIGGANNGAGGNITINGGIVTAIAGTQTGDQQPIGRGGGTASSGELNINNAMVFPEISKLPLAEYFPYQAAQR